MSRYAFLPSQHGSHPAAVITRPAHRLDCSIFLFDFSKRLTVKPEAAPWLPSSCQHSAQNPDFGLPDSDAGDCVRFESPRPGAW
jgi:hypothetical protein